MNLKILCALILVANNPAQGSLPKITDDILLPKVKSALTPSVIVAVIDTGIDTQHPELKENLWINPGETGLDSQGRDKSKNNIDDDGNGYVDDFQGWNFVDNNNKVQDELGHGTHISGVITRTSSQSVRIMPLKYYDPKAKSNVNITNSILAIEYATKMGARVINYSGGGSDKSPLESAAIERAQAQGLVFVAAAGNEGSNTDQFHYYPANYGSKNILSVGAIDEQKNISRFSNYGINSVDIAAQGEMIYSTLPGGKHGFMSGTSQATAKVSGLMADFIAEHPQMNKAADLIAAFIQNQARSPSLKGKTKYQVAL